MGNPCRWTPQSPGISTSLRTLHEGPVPDYSDMLLSGFRRPELHQVIPWICFEAQNMCEPPWCTELALIRQDEIHGCHVHVVPSLAVSLRVLASATPG